MKFNLFKSRQKRSSKITWCDSCGRRRVKGSELVFLHQIKRDGRGTIDLRSKKMDHLDNTVFDLNKLSISNKTYIASELNSYVVRFKQKK